MDLDWTVVYSGSLVQVFRDSQHGAECCRRQVYAEDVLKSFLNGFKEHRPALPGTGNDGRQMEVDLVNPGYTLKG
ncbi:hypothetical protein [Desulfonatronospira thiodismutans]|uniref:hypothetical protein n=1 Tax=Desulfonatronospira thiodismutans TaxID=488939 RepID=UPI0003060C0C|nr:hypothetical protein [Desulfonatronospira thiodismutans]